MCISCWGILRFAQLFPNQSMFLKIIWGYEIVRKYAIYSAHFTSYFEKKYDMFFHYQELEQPVLFHSENVTESMEVFHLITTSNNDCL